MEKGLPKPKKMPDMKDFQLFNHARIAELYELEHQRDLKKAKELKRHIEAKGEAAEPPPEAPPTAEELAELAERERLEHDGFPSWSKQEYTKFLRGSEKHGRTALQPIADEVGTKTLEEVVAYSKAFYAQGPLLIADFDKQEKKIDEGERKIAEKERMATALKAKVSSTDNPWNMLALKYGNNRGAPLQLERPGPQPLAPRVAASRTHGCSLSHIRLQPLTHTVAASHTYGCSLSHIRLQASSSRRRRTASSCA